MDAHHGAYSKNRRPIEDLRNNVEAWKNISRMHTVLLVVRCDRPFVSQSSVDADQFIAANRNKSARTRDTYRVIISQERLHRNVCRAPAPGQAMSFVITQQGAREKLDVFTYWRRASDLARSTPLSLVQGQSKT